MQRWNEHVKTFARNSLREYFQGVVIGIKEETWRSDGSRTIAAEDRDIYKEQKKKETAF